MTVLCAGSQAQTANFHAGDVGFMPRVSGHFIQKTGDTDLKLIALFHAAEDEEITLIDELMRPP